MRRGRATSGGGGARAGAAVALAVATLSYVAVERPFLRRRRAVQVGPVHAVAAEPS